MSKEQLSLTYPAKPGYKKQGTSSDSAEKIAAHAYTVRELVLECFRVYGALTSDEVAKKLALSILTVRPRVAELRKVGAIIDTGARRKNASGHSATVWETK